MECLGGSVQFNTTGPCEPSHSCFVRIIRLFGTYGSGHATRFWIFSHKHNSFVVVLPMGNGLLAPLLLYLSKTHALVWQLATLLLRIILLSHTLTTVVPPNPRIPTVAPPTRVRIWSSTSHLFGQTPYLTADNLPQYFDITRAPLQEFKGVVQLGSRRDLAAPALALTVFICDAIKS